MRMNFFIAQLTPDRPEDAGPSRLFLIVDQHRGVLVEADVAAVGTALLLLDSTTTHLTTSPFLTAAPGIASLTVATKTSPIEA